MTGTRTHGVSIENAALEEMADAGWPRRSWQATAEWFRLTPAERAVVETRLGAVASPAWQRPPYPIDLLYVPSVGGVLPDIGPTSARPWLASLHPKPADPLAVFPASAACYERETIDSMRGAGPLESESVICSSQEPAGATVVVEPNELRVIANYRRRNTEYRRAESGPSVHFLVPLQSVSRIGLGAHRATKARPGCEQPTRLQTHVVFNDGWRICTLDIIAMVGERGITEVNQLRLIEVLLSAVAEAQGLPTPVCDVRESFAEHERREVTRVVDFDGAVSFGVAAPFRPECQTAPNKRAMATSRSSDDEGYDHGNGDAARRSR